jgi:hypothetical protein
MIVFTFHRSVGVKEEANRLTYLQLLALARKLLVTAVPVSIADSILHTKLKNALSRSLLDLSVIALFPEVHADILQFVKVPYHASLKVFIAVSSWVLVSWHVMVHCWVDGRYVSKQHVAFIFRVGP